jgi:hypothetical protein
VNDSQHIGILARLGRWWTERAPHGEFWALVMAALLFNFGVSVFFFLYNLLMLDLGFRERSLGALASALALGSMAGTIPMGMIARRFGLKKVLTVCLLLLAAAFGARVFLFWVSGTTGIRILRRRDVVRLGRLHSARGRKRRGRAEEAICLQRAVCGRGCHRLPGADSLAATCRDGTRVWGLDLWE